MVKPERSRADPISQMTVFGVGFSVPVRAFKSSCAGQRQVRGDAGEIVGDIIVRDKESRPLSRVVAGSD